MNSTNTRIYDELEVPTAINAAGTKTRIGGTRIRQEAINAMRSATNSFVRISDLQARASETIQKATRAEAGYVTTGAAAGLTLGAAACMAGHDLDKMSQLPDTDDFPSEILIPKSQRNSYDHALRASGAELIDVGNNDKTLGTVVSDLEKWEIESAITDDTVALAYVARGELSIDDFVDVGNEYDLPVIVDAAGCLPPKKNLNKYIEAGADLVMFSGGKGIRGPQSTGIVAGRSDLISSIALQHLDMDVVEEVWDPPTDLIDIDSISGVPRHGIGRGFKVGKEELVGIIRALELYIDENEEQHFKRWDDQSRYIGDSLDDIDCLAVSYLDSNVEKSITQVEVTVDETKCDTTAIELVRELRKRAPRIFVIDRDVERRTFRIDPMNVTETEQEHVINKIGRIVSHGS